MQPFESVGLSKTDLLISSQIDQNIEKKDNSSISRNNFIEHMPSDIFVEVCEDFTPWEAKQLAITSKKLCEKVRHMNWKNKRCKLRKVWELSGLIEYRFNQGYNFNDSVYFVCRSNGREDILKVKFMNLNPEQSCWRLGELSSLESFWNGEGVIQINPRVLRPIAGVMEGLSAVGEWISDIGLPKILAPFNRPMDFNPIR